MHTLDLRLHLTGLQLLLALLQKVSDGVYVSMSRTVWIISATGLVVG